MVSTSAFQAEDAGSIPVIRSDVFRTYNLWWNGRMVKATVCKTVCAGSIPASTSAERLSIVVFLMLHADVAQLVAHNLAMVGVAGSSPVIRSGGHYSATL